MIKKTHIIIHHSWLPKDSKFLDWGGIRRHHKSKGWRDIGYHFGIEGYNYGFDNDMITLDYEILAGRMLTESGAHCKQQGMNRKSIGICLLGNFDLKPPPPDQWDLAVKLTRSLMTIFDISKENVDPHSKYATYKSCPGEKFDFDLFRSEL